MVPALVRPLLGGGRPAEMLPFVPHGRWETAAHIPAPPRPRWERTLTGRGSAPPPQPIVYSRAPTRRIILHKTPLSINAADTSVNPWITPRSRAPFHRIWG